MFKTPSILMISCIYPEYYYISTQDATLQLARWQFFNTFYVTTH
ncbi:hypothetical protein [Spiroplasma kunkelii]|nr:hypothetical protein [Spiroplasma kunkelii]